MLLILAKILTVLMLRIFKHSFVLKHLLVTIEHSILSQVYGNQQLGVKSY